MWCVVVQVVLANGAWMQKLLPIPIFPIKGQMMSLRVPQGTTPLSRVLFCDECYIIPKLDGRIVVGATVEEGVFDQNITMAGLQHLVNKFIRACPGLANLPVEETWTGLRPTTPDTEPVLGNTPWENLYVAGKGGGADKFEGLYIGGCVLTFGVWLCCDYCSWLLEEWCAIGSQDRTTGD